MTGKRKRSEPRTYGRRSNNPHSVGKQAQLAREMFFPSTDKIDMSQQPTPPKNPPPVPPKPRSQKEATMAVVPSEENIQLVTSFAFCSREIAERYLKVRTSLSLLQDCEQRANYWYSVRSKITTSRKPLMPSSTAKTSPPSKRPLRLLHGTRDISRRTERAIKVTTATYVRWEQARLQPEATLQQARFARQPTRPKPMPISPARSRIVSTISRARRRV